MNQIIFLIKFFVYSETIYCLMILFGESMYVRIIYINEKLYIDQLFISRKDMHFGPALNAFHDGGPPVLL